MGWHLAITELGLEFPEPPDRDFVSRFFRELHIADTNARLDAGLTVTRPRRRRAKHSVVRRRTRGVRGFCAGCDCPHEEHTAGCRNCDARHGMRKIQSRRRADAASDVSSSLLTVGEAA